MSESRRYKHLVRRLTQLRRRMLPRVFSATGSYNELQLDRARGYRLLVHAEIEAFLEDRAADAVQKAFNGWSKDSKPRHTIISLLAFRRPVEKTFDTLAEAVGFAFGKFNEAVRNNNGLKEENLVKFLPHAGIDWPNLDPTWVLTLNSFGTARGEVAHASARVHQPIDPKSEFDLVTNKILPGLQTLDAVFQKLMQ